MASIVTVLLIIFTSYPPVISYIIRNPEAKGPDYVSIGGYLLFTLLAILNAGFLDPKCDENGIPIEGRFVRSSHHKKSHLIGAILYSEFGLTPCAFLIMTTSQNVLDKDDGRSPFITWFNFVLTLFFVFLMLTAILIDSILKYKKLKEPLVSL